MIVGQAPSRTSCVPLGGRCGERVAEWCGLSSWDELGACFALTNLLSEWYGPDGTKGDLFPLEAARRCADAMLADVIVPEEWDLVVMLGWNVGRAFRVAPRIGYLRPFMLAPDGEYPTEGVVVPHPSGVNRWLNDAENVARLRGYMRSLVC